METIYYLLVGTAAGVLTIFIYWYGRRRKWIGSIPIMSTVVDPLLFSQDQRMKLEEKELSGPLSIIQNETAWYIGVILILAVTFVTVVLVSDPVVSKAEFGPDRIIAFIPYAIFASIVAVVGAIIWLYVTDQAGILSGKIKDTKVKSAQTDTTRFMEEDRTFIIISIVVLGSVFLGIITLVTLATNIISDPITIIITLILNAMIIGSTLLLWYYYWKRKGGVVSGNEVRHISGVEFLETRARYKKLTYNQKAILSSTIRRDPGSKRDSHIDSMDETELKTLKTAATRVYGRDGTGDGQLSNELQDIIEHTDASIIHIEEDHTWRKT